MNQDIRDAVGVGPLTLDSRVEAATRLCVADVEMPKAVNDALNAFLVDPSDSSLRVLQAAVVRSWANRLEPMMFVGILAELLLTKSLTPSETAQLASMLSWSQIDALEEAERNFAQIAQAVHHDEVDAVIQADEDHELVDAARRVRLRKQG